MAVTPSFRIFRAEHTGYDGTEWRVDIHDANAVGVNARETKLTATGVRFSTEGRQELYDWIHPMTAEFTIMIQNADHEAAVGAFATSGPQRYYAFIYKDDVRYFVGMITNDTVEEEDTPYPYGYTIRAIDGLSTLKDAEFSNAGALFTGRESFSRIITRCLSFMPTSGFYDDAGPPTTEYLLHTAVRWWENSMPGTTSDPLEWTRIDHRVFDKREEFTDEPEFYTAWEVLEMICLRWAARLFYAEGSYFLVQPDILLDGASFTTYKYLRGASASTTSGSKGASILVRDATNTGATAAPLAGGVFTYYKSLKEVRLRSLNPTYNFAQDIEWSNAGATAITVADLDTTSGGLRYSLKGRVWIKVSQSTLTAGDTYGVSNSTVPVRARFIIKVTIGASYHHKREIAGQYGYYFWTPKDPRGEWNNGGTFYVHYHSEPFLISGQEHEIDLNLVSPPMPNVGTETLTVEFSSVTLIEQFDWPTATVPNTVVWEARDLILKLTDRNNVFKTDKYIEHVATNDNNNTRAATYTIPFADAVDEWEPSAMDVFTNTGYVKSSAWNYKGTNYSINDLTVFVMASMQKLPMKIRTGGFAKTDAENYSLLNYQGSNYMPLTWAKETNKEEDHGEFIALYQDRTNITITQQTVEVAVKDGEKTAVAQLGPPDYSHYTGLPGLQTEDGLVAGAVTSIDIQAAAYNTFKNGDVIRILDPYTNFSERLTVTANVTAGATTVSVSGTLTNSYFPGSYLFLDPEYASSATPRSSNIESGNWDNVTADFIDTTTPTSGDSITLPDSDTLTAAQINKRVKVWRNGVKQRYRGDYAGAFTDYGFKIDDDNNRIYFYPSLEAEDVEVENIVI